jgi:hypothetical protein
MNWKLLLIALSLVAGIFARPAEDVESTVSVATITDKAEPEVTTSITERTSSTTEAMTTRKLTTNSLVTETSEPSVRYLIANMPTKTTNARNKYANNYANLITKYTINNNRIVSSADGNNMNSNNSTKYNMFLNLNDVVVDNSLPLATVASSATTSNSSSKPLVFVDTDDVNPTAVNPTITTLRAFVPMGMNNGWSNYNLEKPKIVPTRKKKPVIHKIISKWSDNPNEVFNLHGNLPITTQNTVINDLKNNLMQTAFSPGITPESFGFDQLPAILGQQLLLQDSTYRPTNAPATNVIHLWKKRPGTDATKVNCRKVKIKLGNKIGNKNGMSSKEICDDIDIQVNNNIENMNTQLSTTTTEDYEFNNDKFEDSASNSDYGSSEKQEEIDTESPIIVNSITQITRPLSVQETLKGSDKDKKKKKKKPGSGLLPQIGVDDDDEDGGIGGIGGDAGGGGIGTMMVTMMTMMAVFNPLNFGVWGIIMAPMAAMLFAGICYGMYHYMHHGGSKPSWPASDPWPKPQEIIIRNKINHSPIPIKVMHLHKHSRPPAITTHEIIESYGPPMSPYGSPPMESYGPPVSSHNSSPMMSYGPPMSSHKSPPKSYGPPIEIHAPPMTSYKSQPSKSYGEPPVDSYHPSAPSGGPYKRKSNVRRNKPLPGPSKNSYKFKLL